MVSLRPLSYYAIPFEKHRMADSLLFPSRVDWPEEEAEAANSSDTAQTTQHLWEESWDDDDTSDDFSNQLK